MDLPPIPKRPAEFVGTSLDDLAAFPLDVRKVMGHAIFLAQIGGRHSSVKSLKGGKAFKSAGALEIVEDFDGDTYRAVYTVKFMEVVYVLHAFQKKSKTGIATPKFEIDKIKDRLQLARQHFERTYLKKAV